MGTTGSSLTTSTSWFPKRVAGFQSSIALGDQSGNPIELALGGSIWDSNRACSWRINLVDHREPFEIPFMGQIDSHRGENQTKAGFVQPGQSCLIDRNHFNLTIAVDYKFWCPPKKPLDFIGPKLLDFSSLKLWLYCLLRLILVILVDLV